MNSDKLPNYYNVKIEARENWPQPGHARALKDRTFTADEFEAPDPQTAVHMVLNQQWGACDIDEGDTEGWLVFKEGADDGSAPWLELAIEDYGDFATPVPYERRLALAGVRPLGFVQ